MNNGFYEQKADDYDYINFILSHDNETPAHFHNSAEIVFVVEGEFTVRCNGEEQILGKGDVFFAEGYSTHLYKSAKGTVAYVVVLSESYLQDFRAEYRGTFPKFMRAEGEKNEPLFDFLNRAYAQWDKYNKLMRRAFADWILGFLASRYPTSTLLDKQETLPIAGILGYIEKHYAENITAVSLAEEFGYTPNYFSFLFNKFTGVHFRTYLNRVRLMKTQELLKKSPELGIGKAALTCGFLSPNTYYRALALANK